MRPDSQLYIVPAGGGRARRMRANTPLMNSWHSFSPNGRWLVFSSKSRSPYTQMFLTHLDEEGNDSPPILIENATAANRAVNIPEFVNIPPDGLLKIDVPAAEFYRIFDHALDLGGKGQDDAAIAEWNKALEMDPDSAEAHNNLGVLLTRKGSFDQAMTHFRRATELKPDYAQAHYNLGGIFSRQGRWDEAIAEWQRTIQSNPEFVDAHNLLGMALARKGRLDEAIAQWRKAEEVDPGDAEVCNNLGSALVRLGRLDEAIAQLRTALEVRPDYVQAHYALGVALVQTGRFDEAIAHWRRALELKPDYPEAHYSLGRTLYLRGGTAEAMAHWREALRIAPDDLSVVNQTAWALATCPDAPVRNGPEAVRLAERAVELPGGSQPEILDTLAAAYAEAGRFAEAVRTASRALAMATQQNRQSLAEALRARIRLYEANTPFHERRQPSPGGADPR
jgi:tetratricopeptide (TPR) repeat protein